MKFKWGVLLMSAVFSSAGFSSSNVCTSFPGFYSCKNGKVESISGLYGNVELQEVEVTKKIKGIIGAIDIRESTVNHMGGTIGAVRALNSTFLGKIDGIYGVILFEKSVAKELAARNSTAVLDNSRIQKITLSSTEKKIKIILKNKSIVSGDIVFDENFGEVCIDQSSELNGKVINGQVIKGKCEDES